MLEEPQMPSSTEPVRHGTEALTATPDAAVSQGEGPVSQSLPPDASSAYRDPVIWVTSLAVLGAYLAISLFRLLRLNPSSWDLAIYTEYVKQAASFRAPVADVRTAGFNLLGDHFQPIVMAIGPFFRVFPSAVTLLTVQALLAALSVFPVSQTPISTRSPSPSHCWPSRCPRWSAAASRPRSGGRSRWSSSRRTRVSRWPPSAST
jgi:Predicted membrane protein (DUF2079)